MENYVKFSVIMPVYIKENPNFFYKAIESIINQTLKPEQIVIVKDGPLTSDLENVINSYNQQYDNLFTIVSLEKNVGQGYARNAGVKVCRNNYIALMDSDDIALSNRFEIQFKYLLEHPDIDCIGSFITEFEDDETQPSCKKVMPVNHGEIFKFGKWRCPLCNMTVVFKKDKIESVGLYNGFSFGEDWYLFAKMLMAGMKFYNIPQVLVNVRGGSGMLAKRVGLKRIIQETNLFLLFYRMGYINFFECMRNIVLKFLLRIIPTGFRKFIYETFLRQKNNEKIIVIEDGFSLINKTGIGQYTEMISNLLREQNYNVKFVDKSLISKIKNRYIRRVCYSIWLNSVFLIKLILIKGEKHVIFTNFATPIFKIPKIKYYPVIHDIRAFDAPESYNNFINKYQQDAANNAIKNAEKIITVSETMKKSIQNCFELPDEKIKIVFNSLGKHFLTSTNMDNNILDKYSLTGIKYILSVATLTKRKRIPLLINAFEKVSEKKPDLKLVLVGKMDNEEKKALTTNKNVIFTGYIPDEDIPVLYKNALLYVFPSEYEGFGIPILEAQYSKIPIICSDIPVFREIAGNGAEYCQLDLDEIAQKIEYILNTPERINQLIEIGTENVQRFFDNKICEQLMEVIGE